MHAGLKGALRQQPIAQPSLLKLFTGQEVPNTPSCASLVDVAIRFLSEAAPPSVSACLGIRPVKQPRATFGGCFRPRDQPLLTGRQ